MHFTLPLLGILFVGSKLAGFITWSWWLVTLPFWGGLAFLVVLSVVLAVHDQLYGK